MRKGAVDMEFKDWFCLKGRESFTIDPKVNSDDSRFYFGRHDMIEEVYRHLRRSFVEPGVPKMVIYGSYGSGKTQTLFHLEHYLAKNKPAACSEIPRAFHLELEMRSKSDQKDFHFQLMENLGKDLVAKWVENLFNKTSNLE